MNAVLISIQPKWCKKIASGEKTVEVRKTRPKIKTPFKCYIYESKGKVKFYSQPMPIPYYEGKGMVIGEFVCNKITLTSMWRLLGQTGRCAKRTEDEEKFPLRSCLTLDEIGDYAGSEHRILYGWHISDLVIYDKPKGLSEISCDCKFKQEDGTCNTKLVACSYQRIDYNQDGSINLVECGKRVERAPQSWCYVEDGQ